MEIVAADLMTVPEHSAAFMQAVAGGKAFVRDGFFFLSGRDWLVGIGYPLTARGPAEEDPNEKEPDAGRDFLQALRGVLQENAAFDCWVIAPRLPDRLVAYRTESDLYYTLPSDSPVPARLRTPVQKAGQTLCIKESRHFDAGHRRLWAEFLRFRQLKPQARELFVKIPSVLNAPGSDVRLLDARKTDGTLAACLVMDYAPGQFCSYLIGAHSRDNYVPHAADALFAYMLQRAKEEGKKYIHLGLGVNEGIRRFKQKWGGEGSLPYEAAFFPASALLKSQQSTIRPQPLRELAFASMLPEQEGVSPLLSDGDSLPDQRPYAMLWQLRKNGKISWIGGTAHAFCYSFASSLRKLFKGVSVVLLEGPLDAASLAAFDEHGQMRGADTPRLLDFLTEAEVRNLERIVQGPQGKLAVLLNAAWPKPAKVRDILDRHRPWSVFFTLYYAFLERHGWNQSVDLEAWEIARQMGKQVISMESVEEQLASLESVPLDRILRFLKAPEDWSRRMKQSRAAYLTGDFRHMFDTGADFPTRTGEVIGLRDQRFRERMLPWIEQGGAAVFVGTAHMFNLQNMLREDGFEVVQVFPTWRRKLLSRLRGR